MEAEESLEEGWREICFAFMLVKAAWACGVNFLLVHPATSLIWLLPELKELLGLSGVKYVETDQCPWGGGRKGP